MGAEKWIIAVSGGVDSVVLLDVAARTLGNDRLVVAHFDHGIRHDSARDALFVKTVAKKYGLPFEAKREDLGADASEELARDRRYTFLRNVAKKHGAKIMTAHHADDVVETIAINATRGTGWRGLAVLDSVDIVRPLLEFEKSKLLEYAKKHRLVWREDITNKDTKYLRNALRQKLKVLSPEDKSLLRLYRQRQVILKKKIDAETERLISGSPYSRHMFITVPDIAAIELLRGVFMKEAGFAPTIPQRERALHAIKTMAAGKRFEVAKGVTLRFSKTTLVVEVTTGVLS